MYIQFNSTQSNKREEDAEEKVKMLIKIIIDVINYRFLCNFVVVRSSNFDSSVGIKIAVLCLYQLAVHVRYYTGTSQ